MKYGLNATMKIEGIQVTDAHREEALALTLCESLILMDAAVSSISPHVRRYGGTFGAILEQFVAARGVIEEEMSRVANRNLECVVTGNSAGARILNLEIYVAMKEARTPVEPNPTGEVTEPDPPVADPVDPPAADTPPVKDPDATSFLNL